MCLSAVLSLVHGAKCICQHTVDVVDSWLTRGEEGSSQLCLEPLLITLILVCQIDCCGQEGKLYKENHDAKIWYYYNMFF